MIQEYEGQFALEVNALGKSLNSAYDVKKRGEQERILVYTKEDRVIGFVQYIKLYETVEILYLVVNREYRRLGIGAEFIDFFSRDLDVEKIIIEVRISNETAISFYEKNGFRRVRPIKDYYKNGEDALAMEKVIKE